MEYNFVEILLIGVQLITDPDPPMAFITLGEIDRSYRIGIGKEQSVGMYVPADPLFDVFHFMVQHLLEPGFRYIPAIFLDPVDGIAKILVVGAHCRSEEHTSELQ